MEPLISISNLEIKVKQNGNLLVKDVSFEIGKGEILGVVGESGSGKSLTCFSLLGLLPNALSVKGSIQYYSSKIQEVLKLNKEDLRQLRAKEISMIFQEPLTALNPVLKCKKQLFECLEIAGIKKNRWYNKSKELLDEVSLFETERILESYPFQLSGGQRQRVMIAMALASNPKLIIADEPTTALDVIVTADIMTLLKELCLKRGLSILFVSHDLPLIRKISDTLLVMYKGEAVEYGTAEKVLNSPKSAYTKSLLACVPRIEDKGYKLPSINEVLIEKENKLSYVPHKKVKQGSVLLKDEIALKTLNLTKIYKGNRDADDTIALDRVNLVLKKGECLGVVGASGSGKSTLAKLLVNLEEKTSGSVHIYHKEKEVGVSAINIQMVFQDPFSSLNPLLNVKNLLIEPILANKVVKTKKEAIAVAMEALNNVGLKSSDLDKYPHEFSGGQRQRINVARALCLKSKILILDESVSALDVSVQAQVLNLLKELQISLGLTYLFITHDLEVAAYFCERIAVMNKGQIVEIGDSLKLFNNPETDYAKKLLAI